MSGLEAVEVKLSESQQNKDFRLDTAFHTTTLQRNSLIDYAKIGDCLIGSQYGISIEMNEEGKGYPIYRMNEIRNMLCDLTVYKFADITPVDFETFKLNSGDVVFNRTNSYEWVGRTGVYYPNDTQTPMVFASYLVRFVTNESKILPEYLSAFLSCRFGIAEIRRRARQSINQTNVNPEEVKEIEIPLLDLELQRKIQDNFIKAHQLRIKAEGIYALAEKMLLGELGMTGFVPSNEPIAVKYFSESFGASGRLDAEYYQPKYEDIQRIIKSYYGGYTTIGKSALYIFTGEYSEDYQTKDDSLHFYIRGTNLSLGQVEMDESYFVNPDGFTKFAKSGDIVTGRVGTLGEFATINNELHDSVYSDNILCFRLPNEYMPQVYTLFLNTEFSKELIGRLSRGSVQQRLNQETLKDMIIPILSTDAQEKVADKIQNSFALRRQSEQLLEAAKRAVEIAIEENEESAIKFLEDRKNEQ